MRKLKIIALAVFLQMQFGAAYVFAQVPQAENITRQERLRGSVTPEREWWDLQHYHLKVEFLPERRTLKRVKHNNLPDPKIGKQNAN